MNIDLLKKSVKMTVLSAGLILVSAAANAQTVDVGSNVSLNLGKDVKAAHASEGKAGVDKNGNLNAGGAVADGLRVGDSKFQSGVHGAISVPAAAVAAALD